MISNLIEKLFLISFSKSLIYSIRYRGKIIVGRYAKIKIRKGGGINLTANSKLFIGVYFSLPQKIILDIYSGGELNINGSVNLCTGSKILIGENAVLNIGDKTYINEHSRIQCRKKIDIGKCTAISWGVNIMDTDEHYLVVEGNEKNKVSEVTIGEHVWIGANATILKGSSIGNNSVVGANSVVNSNFSDSNLIVGNPAYSKITGVNWK